MRPVEAPPRNVHAYVTYAHAIDASECGCITQTYSYGHAARGPAFAHMAPRQSVKNKKPRNRRRPLFYLGYHREQNGVAIRCRRTQQVGLELFRVCRLPFRIRVSGSRCRHSCGGGDFMARTPCPRHHRLPSFVSPTRRLSRPPVHMPLRASSGPRAFSAHTLSTDPLTPTQLHGRIPTHAQLNSHANLPMENQVWVPANGRRDLTVRLQT